MFVLRLGVDGVVLSARGHLPCCVFGSHSSERVLYLRWCWWRVKCGLERSSALRVASDGAYSVRVDLVVLC